MNKKLVSKVNKNKVNNLKTWLFKKYTVFLKIQKEENNSDSKKEITIYLLTNYFGPISLKIKSPSKKMVKDTLENAL